jgi:hypothetical protein
MTQTACWVRRLLVSGVLATLLAGSSGCLNFLSPIPDPPPDMAGPCLALPPYVKKHVYVFMMNGVDPLGMANLNGLREHVLKLGFNQAYNGQLYHIGWYEREIQRIHKEDPDGRIVLIGYGHAAKVLAGMANRLVASGVHIEVLLALDAGSDAMEHEGAFPVRNLGAPCLPETIAQVAWTLGQCASNVTVIEPPLPEGPEKGPVPRPVVPLAPQSFGPDWDSLKPLAQLR